VIPVALLIKNAPAEMGAVALGGAAAARREYTTAEVVRAPQFWAIALTHLACCAAHSGPIFHMVTYAIEQGVAAMVAATVFGVSGLASIAGRIGCGILADRFGAKRTLLAGLALQAVTILSPTADALIRYTTDGTLPSATAGTELADGGVVPGQGQDGRVARLLLGVFGARRGDA